MKSLFTDDGLPFDEIQLDTELPHVKMPSQAPQQFNDLVELVRWLAMPYGDNMPVFATELPDGRPLETGKKLSELYMQVVGEKRPTPGAWVQCKECRSWYVHHPDSDRHWNDHDVHEAAKSVAQRVLQANS